MTAALPSSREASRRFATRVGVVMGLLVMVACATARQVPAPAPPPPVTPSAPAPDRTPAAPVLIPETPDREDPEIKREYKKGHYSKSFLTYRPRPDQVGPMPADF